MKCPKCNETLVMSDRNGVEIDYCPSCRGVWLDRGELDKILERSGDFYSNKDNYREDYKSGDYKEENYKYQQRPYKKRKSFFGDFFDFD